VSKQALGTPKIVGERPLAATQPARTAGYNPMAQSRVYIGLPEGHMKEISMEERRAENEKIILQNARHDDLRHKLCPLHGLVRDDGEHANCRVSSVPWWARHGS
jgi:hypothetical protein